MITMNSSSIVVKTAVIISSVILFTGYVLYQGGVLDNLIVKMRNGSSDGNARGSALTASLGYQILDTVDDRTGDSLQRPSDSSSRIVGDDTARTRYHFFPGSKSAAPLIKEPPVDSTDSADSAERNEVFMGSSKSMAPLIRPRSVDSQRIALPDSSQPSRHAP